MSQNIQGSPDAKKPCKGILKTSSSFDKHSATASHRKSAKFDEINVLQTYHPPDKDYGHMKIQEPKTPYNFNDPDSSNLDYFDPEILADKLREVQDRLDDIFSKDSDEEEETEEQAARRKEFEKRRKAHYNEFEAVKLARKLIEEEDDDDDDEEDNAKADHKSKDGGTSSRTKDEMEVEENQKEDAQNTSPSSDR